MSEFLVVGFNHRSTPLEIREKVSFSKQERISTCQKLGALSAVNEAMVLSTCNRTEFLMSLENLKEGKKIVIDFLAHEKNIPVEDLEKYIYFYPSQKGFEHVFRVASGLDSMVLGEHQITAQLKEAYESAVGAGTCDKLLHPLIQQALKSVKIVRRNTHLSENSISLGSVAVEFAQKIFGNLVWHNGLLIGTGEILEQAAYHLRKNGIKSLNVVNRTYSKAEKLAQRFKGSAFSIDDLLQSLFQADVVISSTGSSQYLIKKELVGKVMEIRKYKSMFFIDLGVPRDIEPDISSVKGVYLYNIEDLEEAVKMNIQKRRRESKIGDKIIRQQIIRFQEKLDHQQISPLIHSLKNRAETIRQEEVKKTMKKLKRLSPKEKNELERLSSAIVNKLLHDPFMALKKFSSDEKKKNKYQQFIKDIFNLE